MKTYKIFYCEKEICEFDTMQECIEYITKLAKIDSKLIIKDFSIYVLAFPNC